MNNFPTKQPFVGVPPIAKPGESRLPIVDWMVAQLAKVLTLFSMRLLLLSNEDTTISVSVRRGWVCMCIDMCTKYTSGEDSIVPEQAVTIGLGGEALPALTHMSKVVDPVLRVINEMYLPPTGVAYKVKITFSWLVVSVRSKHGPKSPTVVVKYPVNDLYGSAADLVSTWSMKGAVDLSEVDLPQII